MSISVKDSYQAAIIELKQGSGAEQGSALGDQVLTWVGGGQRDVLHPSRQVGQYQQYLGDNHEVFYADPSPIGLSACAYVHNYHARQDLSEAASQCSNVQRSSR